MAGRSRQLWRSPLVVPGGWANANFPAARAGFHGTRAGAQLGWRVRDENQVAVLLLEISPVPAVMLEQGVRLSGSPASGGIVGKGARWQSFPDIEHRTDHVPTRLHHIGALE